MYRIDCMSNLGSVVHLQNGFAIVAGHFKEKVLVLEDRTHASSLFIIGSVSTCSATGLPCMKSVCGEVT